MPLTVSSTYSHTLGPNLLGAIKSHLPSAVKTIAHCGIELAKLPLKEAKNLASQFSGINMSTPLADMALNWTQTATETLAEKGTKYTMSATDWVAKKVAGR